MLLLVGATRQKGNYVSKKTGEQIFTDEIEVTLLEPVDVGKGKVVDGFGFTVKQVFQGFMHAPRFDYTDFERVTGVKTIEQFQERYSSDLENGDIKPLEVYYDENKKPLKFELILT